MVTNTNNKEAKQNNKPNQKSKSNNRKQKQKQKQKKWAPIPLGSGRCGTVIRTKLKKRMVALKIADLWKDPALYVPIKNEISMYRKFQDLQGSFIPTLIWDGHFGSNLYGLATSIEGEPLPVRLTRNIKLGALRCLRAIHQKGYAHGDVRRENFVRRSDGRIILLDLEACKAASKQDFLQEEKDVIDLL